MSALDKIKKPIENELKDFEKRFRSDMESKVPLLDKIMYYIVKRKGKQMRPIIVFLSANLVSSTSDATYRAASMIELLHTATLVHDDVVDDADQRRGFFSINALWKNKIAVLVGDYLLSRGLLLAIDNGDFNVLRIVSKAVKDMSEGELLQIEKARRLDIKEDVYYDIIRQKTASLMASACSAGVASVTEDKELIEKARLLGEKMGIAFQLKDDLFDFGDEQIGKPTGIDIKEKKMTLPLIFALENASWAQKTKIINKIRWQSTNPRIVKQVIEFVRGSGGIEYAQKAMDKYLQESYDILDEFPESPAKESMYHVIDYISNRKK